MKSLRTWWNNLHVATQGDIITAIAVLVMILVSILFAVFVSRHACIA